MNKNLIIVLEDDPHQSESMENDLRVSCPNYEIRMCPTELEYRKLVDMDADRIAAVVLDAMVPWEFPNEDMRTPPPEVQNDGMFKAGLRCHAYLRNKPNGRNIPILVHTVLDRDDAGFEELDAKTLFLRKTTRNNDLVANIQTMIGTDVLK